MSNHPNRSKSGSAARNPDPQEVVALREQYGLTQDEASVRWMTTRNAVQKWEAPIGSDNSRRVHPLMWWGMQKILAETDSKPIEQLKDTSAMLAVLLEDIYDVATDTVKNRICEELGKINQCIRDADNQE